MVFNIDLVAWIQDIVTLTFMRLINIERLTTESKSLLLLQVMNQSPNDISTKIKTQNREFSMSKNNYFLKKNCKKLPNATW